MIHPVGARLLVQRIEEQRPTSSTIVIPETIEQKQSNYAIVYAVGALKQSVVNVGNIVILSHYAGAPVNVTLPGDEQPSECIIVDEESVLAIVEGD